MDHGELIRTLSACDFYQRYLELQPGQPPAEPQPPPEAQAGESPGRSPPDSEAAREKINRVFTRYCVVLGSLFLGDVLLLVAPLWLVYPPYGRACLLGLPPMILCALSWMAGAWWAWDRNQHILMAVTMGASPVRMLLILVWAWLVLTIPEVSVLVFMFGLVLHWTVFTIPEFAMLLEMTKAMHAKPATKEEKAEEQPQPPERTMAPGEGQPVLQPPHFHATLQDRKKGVAAKAGSGQRHSMP